MMNSGLSPRIQQAESAPLQIHGALSGSELAEHCSRKSALPSAVDLLRSDRPVIMNGGYISVITTPKRSSSGTERKHWPEIPAERLHLLASIY